MDYAYDHIVEESLPKDNEENPQKKVEQQSTLNQDIQEGFRAISQTKWGSSLWSYASSAYKQGDAFVREAQYEIKSAGVDASREIQNLYNRTRSLSVKTATPADAGSSQSQEAGDKGKGADATPTAAKASAEDEESFGEQIRAELRTAVKQVRAWEDAADDSLVKAGRLLGKVVEEQFSSILTITAPSGSKSKGGSVVMFESQDASGKRAIHSSRYDAELHSIHTRPNSLLEGNFESDEFNTWAKDFDADKKTEDISRDLSKYPELKTMMEKLTPAQIPYAEFWKRYYFLQHNLATLEAQRKELVKGTLAQEDEEIGWDDDSDDEANAEKSATKPVRPASAESSTTIHPPPAGVAPEGLLKPSEPRKSNDEKSQADSDTSYDVVGATSGVPSQAPSSPKEPGKADESDEEDWE